MVAVGLAMVVAGCSDGPSPSSPAVEALDFLYQARVDDGFGVFVSVEGEVLRVDEAAPGTRHKHPVWTADGSQLAFVAEGEWDATTGAVVRGSEVWTVDPTGDNAQPLITCDCWDLNNPAWSPSGDRVAYVEYDAPIGEGPPAASRIAVFDPATGERTVIVSSAPGQLIDIPRWSPDGTSLVVSIDRFDDTGNETGSSFGVVSATGADTVEPLLPFEDYAYAADWNWVAGALVFSVEAQEYASPEQKVSPWDLFEIQPDGSGRRAITDIGQRRLLLPMWSSDGSLIAATLDTTPGEPGGQHGVVVDPVTGAITALPDANGDYARLRPSS